MEALGMPTLRVRDVRGESDVEQTIHYDYSAVASLLLFSGTGESAPGAAHGAAAEGARGGVTNGAAADGLAAVGVGGAPGGAIVSASNADVLFVNPQRPRSPLGGVGGADEAPVLHLARNSRLTLKEEREAADRSLRVQNTVSTIVTTL